jgi:hypothetical protein
MNGFKDMIRMLGDFLSRGFLVKTVILSSLISLFLQVPSFPEIESLFPTRAILEISKDPWTQIHYDAGSHAEKKTLRPLVPLMAKVLHLEFTWQVYLLFVAGNVVLLALVARLIERETGDRMVAFATTLGLSCAYFGFSGFGDTKGWGDVIPFALILASMVWSRPMVVFITHFLAMTGDERAVITAALVSVWWVLKPDGAGVRAWQDRFMNQRWLVLSSLAALAGFIGLRLYMHRVLGFQMPMGNVGWQVLLDQNPELLLPGVWGAFEGYWMFLIFYLFRLMRSMRWMESVVLSMGFSAYLIACMMVHDVTRSISYAFPLVLLAIIDGHRSSSGNGKSFESSFLLISFINVVSPTQYLYGKLRCFAPAFFRIIQFFQ